MNPKLCLLDNWRRVLRRAWSIRFSLLAAAFIAILDGNLLLDLMEKSGEKRELRREGLRRLAKLVVLAKARA